jgi:hypothetical protein
MRRILFVLAIVLASAGFSFASDAPFRAPRVDYPNGGEFLAVGVPVSIQWMSPGVGEAIIRVSLSMDGGKSYKNVLTEFWTDDKSPSNQSWMWNNPRQIGTEMKVKVAYFTQLTVVMEDESDGTFTIATPEMQPVLGISVITPNGGEKFVRGDPILIQWKLHGILPDLIEIRLSTDGGSSYPNLLAELKKGPKMLGWYWDNEKIVGKGMRISVTAYTKEDGKFTDTSNRSFVIVPPDNMPDYPKVFSNATNYPNPFNPTTTIEFNLVESGTVTLTVFNMLGEQVTMLVNGYLDQGSHTVQFSGAGLPSGTYLYRLDTAGETMTQMMQLMK